MSHDINSLLLAIALFSSQLFAAENLLPPADKNQFNTPITLKELSQSPYYIKVRDAYESYTIPHSTIQPFLSNKKGPGKDIIRFPEQFVINLPNAQIIGDNDFQGLVITEDNRPLIEYVSQKKHVINEGDWRVHSLKMLLQANLPTQPENFNGSIAVLVATGSCCFYHWMFEMLPRLQTLQMSGIPYDKIYVGSQKEKYKKATLVALGIPESKILYGEGITNIKATNIIIPSMPHLYSFTRPTWACKFLRDGFLNETSTDTTSPRKRIYIARKYSSSNIPRFIVNEKELIAYLETKGFTTVLLEDLSNKEQAQLINSSEIIIAAHGAGLSNLVFCNSKLPVTVIEFHPPSYVLECFSMLIEQLNRDMGFHINYTGMITSTEQLSGADIKQKNIYVNLKQLDQALSSAL